MRSALACLACATVQGLRVANAATDDPELLSDAYLSVLEAIEGFDLDASPAANATIAVKAACKAVKNEDPYRAAKREQNRLALEMEQETHRTIEESRDRIETGLLVSCLGNVIDLGAQDSYDLRKEMDTMLQTGFERSDIDDFRKRLSNARSLLLIADNSGEIVFDRSLLETIPSPIRKTVAVKSGPIINDATVDDALAAGLDRIARVITTGGDDLGVDSRNCSEEFMRELDSADIVLAKGHANFETLNESGKGIFFLLKAKCDVVASELQVSKGSLVFARF